jgi:Mn-dependent DtxR family transcriptional regulator
VKPSMHAVKRGFSRQEAAHYLGVSETSVRELEKLGYVTRHKLLGLTLEVFYKEELDAYLDKSLARELLTVVDVNTPRAHSTKPNTKRHLDTRWTVPLDYNKEKK